MRPRSIASSGPSSQDGTATRTLVHRLRSTVAVALVGLPVATIVATTAEAAPIKECGNFGYRTSTGKVSWGSSPVSGAGTFNVTARVVSCKTARRVALKASPGRSYRGWKCRYVSEAHEYADVRCTRDAGRVVRFQTGA